MSEDILCANESSLFQVQVLTGSTVDVRKRLPGGPGGIRGSQKLLVGG